VNADQGTLATAFYVTTNYLLASHPECVPPRLHAGIALKITDAELLTLAVMEALLVYTNEARGMR
jgi:hypothetical protein